MSKANPSRDSDKLIEHNVFIDTGDLIAVEVDYYGLCRNSRSDHVALQEVNNLSSFGVFLFLYFYVSLTTSENPKQYT